MAKIGISIGISNKFTVARLMDMRLLKYLNIYVDYIKVSLFAQRKRCMVFFCALLEVK